MTWTSEKQMVDAFTQAWKLHQNNRDHDSLTLHETDTSYGRADMMVVEYDMSMIRQRNTLSGPQAAPFTQECAYAMAYLTQKKWATFEYLQEFLRCSKSKLVSIVNDLARRNLIQVHKESVQARKLDDTFHLNRILVFEAKLSKWREAIAQAERHLWFTGASYVVLPAERKGVVDSARQECEQKGLGLISFSKEGEVNCLVTPSDMRIYNTYFCWVINEQLVQKNTYAAHHF